MAIRKRNYDELGRIEAQDYALRAQSQTVLVLDNLRSMHNVGSIFRTADAFGVGRLALCGITAQPPHRDIAKAALGATDWVPFTYYPTTSEALNQLISDGFTLVAIELATPHIPLQQFVPDKEKKYAFILGNEVEGIDDSILAMCHLAIEIPQLGSKHSFNVSVTTGILLWHYNLNM